MLPRVLEPEVMDEPGEALAYDQMDFTEVNRAFVSDWSKAFGQPIPAGMRLLDVGCGTGRIPIEFARTYPGMHITGIDLAHSMIELGQKHLDQIGLRGQVLLRLVDAKQIPFADQSFDSVVSNSIVHHIPDPFDCVAGMVRVCAPGGLLFVRDLFRPESAAEVDRLVDLHSGDSDERQRGLFRASFYAALTLEEVRDLVGRLGFGPETVRASSDRHWTFAARKPASKA